VAGDASFAELASLGAGWRVLAGRRVEALAFVVEGVAGDEPGVVPDLDGFGGHAEAAGHLGQGEHAGVAESLLAAAEPVVVADVADDEPVEGAAFAAGQAAVVEDGGDLGVGVAVEELVDGGDGFGGGLAELGGGGRDGQGEGAGLAGGEPDVRGDGVAGAGDGDVGEQQPGDALAFAGRGGGVVPDRGQVGDELLDPGFLGGGELPGVVLAGVVVGVPEPVKLFETSSCSCGLW